jgi:hypothetical protein
MVSFNVYILTHYLSSSFFKCSLIYIFQQVFSRVCAKLDYVFAAQLPPDQDLKNFIDNLLGDISSNFDVLVDEKDGDLCISGSWNDVATIEVLLQQQIYFFFYYLHH